MILIIIHWQKFGKNKTTCWNLKKPFLHICSFASILFQAFYRNFFVTRIEKKDSFATKEPVIVPTKPLVRLLEKVYDLQTHLRSLDSDKITLVEHAAVFICYENIQEYANHLLTRILKVLGFNLFPFLCLLLFSVELDLCYFLLLKIY